MLDFEGGGMIQCVVKIQGGKRDGQTFLYTGESHNIPESAVLEKAAFITIKGEKFRILCKTGLVPLLLVEETPMT